MTEDKYKTKKECIKEGFQKTSEGIKKLCVLEKYFEKGWLEYGNKKYCGQDRLKAGLRLYSDYKRGHVAGFVYSNWSPIITTKASAIAGDDMFDARSRYFSVIRTMPREFWQVVRTVCIEDVEIIIKDDVSARRRSEIVFSLKMDLCRGLDRVVRFYYGAK